MIKVEFVHLRCTERQPAKIPPRRVRVEVNGQIRTGGIDLINGSKRENSRELLRSACLHIQVSSRKLRYGRRGTGMPLCSKLLHIKRSMVDND